jgi:tetratricopeptide (TPR) repeat protein
MTWRRALATATAFATILLAACSQTTTGTSAPPTSQSRTAESSSGCALPDLSELAVSVQKQIRDGDADLQQALRRPGTSPTDRAAAYGALGRMLMAAKFSQEAASCFALAEGLAPADVRWPYYSGHAYLRSGDRAQAAAAFERALKAKPGDLTALVWLGESYLDDDRLDLAQAAFQRAIAAQPQSAPALFGAGRTALARREYSEAAQDLEQALAIDPRGSAIHYPLAMAYRALGEGAKADAHLRQRGNNYPVLPDALMQDDEDVLESPMSFENRGMAALKSADFATAIAAFQKGLRLAPGDTSLRYWLGAAFYASGKPEDAVREFSEVVQRDPDFAKAHFSLGAIYDAKQQRGKALEEYQAAIRADPNLPESRLRLADDLRTSGQLAASVDQYEAAVKLDPSIVDAWIGGAHALIDLKRMDQAIDWLTRARRLYPARPELAQMQARLK